MTNDEFKELKTGTIVMCNKAGIYRKTTTGIRCEVIEIRPESHNNIRVQILDGDYKCECYSVRSEYFDIYHPLKFVAETEVLSLLV